jgi:RNA polymerase sigma-70 factor, ECF subfamily
VGPDPGPAERAELAGQRVARNRAIMRLSFDQHAALVLREFGGLTYEEVARVLGVSVGAVNGRLYRARVELAEPMRLWR